MAQVYAGRWRIVDGPELGHGGQSRVFRVTDMSGEYQGEFALKRVLNPKRHDRFRREIDAVKRLMHRNIIKLIDHSALDDAGGASDKQFLVMPIARNGDLSKRVSLYRDSIDSVLPVAKQLADALRVAHGAGVIHRDVKPENVLFADVDHEPWLTDFGICLLREEPRITESREVVGPWAFMAPELEDGGKLEVNPAADVYSLGKVVYYMVTGGTVLPRERLDEEKYRQVFARGERYRLLELLLRQMICVVEQRIQSMEEVIKELEKIEAWEHSARLLPISDEALAGIEQLKRRSLEAGRITAGNEQARHQEEQTLGSVQASMTGWLTSELKKVASMISSDSIQCEVREAGMPQGRQLVVQTGAHAAYGALNGVELVLVDRNDAFGRVHGLTFFLCRHNKMIVTVRSGPVPPPTIEPTKDLELALLPFYRQTQQHRHPTAYSATGYLGALSAVGTVRGAVTIPPGQRPQVQYHRVELISNSFDLALSLHVDFRASQWPGNVEQVQALVKSAIDTFVTYITAS
jgi:serine/threonine protein kinase